MLVVSAVIPFICKKKRIVVWNKINPITDEKVATSLSSFDIPWATDIQNKIGSRPKRPPARELTKLTKPLTKPTLASAFPVAGMLIKKGVSFRNVFLFLGSWSTMKIPMMLFEVAQLGSRFAAARFAFNFVGIIILAWIMDKTMSKEEEEYMLQH